MFYHHILYFINYFVLYLLQKDQFFVLTNSRAHWWQHGWYPHHPFGGVAREGHVPIHSCGQELLSYQS